MHLEGAPSQLSFAALLELSSPRSVSTYRARYADFPAPFIEKPSGKCVLWLRQDVERWAAARSRT